MGTPPSWLLMPPRLRAEPNARNLAWVISSSSGGASGASGAVGADRESSAPLAQSDKRCLRGDGLELHMLGELGDGADNIS